MKIGASRRAVVFTLLALVVTALAVSARLSQRTVGQSVAAHTLGVSREGSSAERARERAHATTIGQSATFGPTVGTGDFQGVSTPVADLPVVQARKSRR